MQVLRVLNSSFNQHGAALIASLLRAKPNANLVIATGNTPMGVYDELAKLKLQGELDSSSLHAFQLDAYADVPLSDPRSLQGWSRRSFVEPLGLAEKQFTPLIGYSDNHERACQSYHDAVIKAGGYDLAILGLGPNGHLGFNEPPSSKTSTTRVISLTEESLISNAVYWGRGNVPTQALTAGMDLLLAAKQILLLVTGKHKYEILQKTLYGAITPEVPSSYLQASQHVMVLADEAALGS